MADEIFKHITAYGIMHSSQLIGDAVIKALEMALPSIGDYLESRLLPAEIDSLTQNPIKDGFWFGRLDYADSIGDYGMITAKAWPHDSVITDKMFEKKKVGVS